MHPCVLLVTPPGCQEDELREWEQFLMLHGIPFEHQKDSNNTNNKKDIKMNENANDNGKSLCLC